LFTPKHLIWLFLLFLSLTVTKHSFFVDCGHIFDLKTCKLFFEQILTIPLLEGQPLFIKKKNNYYDLNIFSSGEISEQCLQFYELFGEMLIRARKKDYDFFIPIHIYIIKYILYGERGITPFDAINYDPEFFKDTMQIRNQSHPNLLLENNNILSYEFSNTIEDFTSKKIIDNMKLNLKIPILNVIGKSIRKGNNSIIIMTLLEHENTIRAIDYLRGVQS